MKRNIIEEIVEKNKRNPKRSNRIRVSGQKFLILLEINNFLSKDKTLKPIVKKELTKYIPVALVNILENYIKQLIKKLIQSNKEYLLHVGELKNIKIDLETLVNAQVNSLTIADLVIHLISTNSFNDIVSNLSTILGDDFLKIYKNLFKANNIYIEKITPQFVFEGIKKTFKMRNIIVHECSPKISFDYEELKDMAGACMVFTHISEYLISS